MATMIKNKTKQRKQRMSSIEQIKKYRKQYNIMYHMNKIAGVSKMSPWHPKLIKNHEFGFPKSRKSQGSKNRILSNLRRLFQLCKPHLQHQGPQISRTPSNGKIAEACANSWQSSLRHGGGICAQRTGVINSWGNYCCNFRIQDPGGCRVLDPRS